MIAERMMFSADYEKELSEVSYNKALEYVKRSMQSVGADYTARSKEAGERVKNHLALVLSNVTYRYQGSVETDTHIMGRSDIDLLVICDKSFHYDRAGVSQELANPFVNENRKSKLRQTASLPDYNGNQIVDLFTIRLESEKKLQTTYDVCDVSKAKAIRIENKDLKREVDIVTAGWYRSVESIANPSSDNKSIQVFDKSNFTIGHSHSPFLAIKRINDRDIDVNGRLKKMIRFLKNLKCDADADKGKIDLNSFDINAICYSILPQSYSSKDYIELVGILYNHLKTITESISYRDDIISVDGSEYIFRNKPSKLEAVTLLLQELHLVAKDIVNELNYRRIAV
jgi:hypothetical protein